MFEREGSRDRNRGIDTRNKKKMYGSSNEKDYEGGWMEENKERRKEGMTKGRLETSRRRKKHSRTKMEKTIK